MKKYKFSISKFLASVFISSFPMLAQASSFGDDGFSLTTALNQLIQLLSSQIGGAVCVLAITGVGYAWLRAGRIEKSVAITTIVGISVIFSAAWIAQYLGFTS